METGSIDFKVRCGTDGCDDDISVRLPFGQTMIRYDYSWVREPGREKHRLDVAFVRDGEVEAAVLFVDDGDDGVLVIDSDDYFIPTHRFDGPKRGMEFRVGDRGVGYYPVPADKKETREALTDAEVAWVEVFESDILDSRGINVAALRCAAVECRKCEEIRMKRADDLRRQRMEKEAEVERKISRGIPRLETRRCNSSLFGDSRFLVCKLVAFRGLSVLFGESRFLI